MLICNSSQNSFQLKKFLMWKIGEVKPTEMKTLGNTRVPVETKG